MGTGDKEQGKRTLKDIGKLMALGTLIALVCSLAVIGGEWIIPIAA